MSMFIKIKILIVFLSSLLVFPINVFAWGPATHAYIAKQLCGDYYDIYEIYGSVLPDFYNDKFDAPYNAYLTKIAHYNLDKLKKESRKNNLYNFALGYISHNEKWGADLTAHKKARTIKKGKGYIIEKIKILAPIITSELSEFLKNQGASQHLIVANLLSSEITHPLLEFAVDIKIKSNEDSIIGADLIYSAENRSDVIPDILALSYANSLSKKFKISIDAAIDIIKDSEKSFQSLMIIYGEILNQETNQSILQLSEDFSIIINTYLNKIYSNEYFLTPEIMERFIKYAIDIIEDDYSKEVSETIKYLKKKSIIKQFCRKITK